MLWRKGKERQGLVGTERMKRRGCGDRAISVRGEAGGSRTDGETTGDEINHKKQQRMGDSLGRKHGGLSPKQRLLLGSRRKIISWVNVLVTFLLLW